MELVDIYNDKHELLGYTKDRKELKNGEYRISSFIWVINSNDQILIQQRLSTAKKMPNMWGTTAGGAQAGDTSLNAAMRELEEELGIKTKSEEMQFIGSYKRLNDFVEVWLCKKDVTISDLKLQKEEVQDAKWVTIDEFEQMLMNGEGIRSGYDIFKMYYDEFYNKYIDYIDGKPVIKELKSR